MKLISTKTKFFFQLINDLLKVNKAHQLYLSLKAMRIFKAVLRSQISSNNKGLIKDGDNLNIIQKAKKSNSLNYLLINNYNIFITVIKTKSS